MSHPASVWRAEFKPFQLCAAAEAGLPIPRTVITNDPGVVRSAFTKFGQMIAKPVRSGYLTQAGKEFSIFTSQVLAEHLDELEDVRLSPAIYQELVPKLFDVRVTVVGRRLFAAAIDSQSDPEAIIDWRRTGNPKLPHHRIDLPSSLSVALLRLMDDLNLAFGAIDMIQRENGEFVFLEVNPSGQWLWLDDMLQFGISDAVAAWLSGEPVS